MRILIIEDEHLAARKLSRLLKEIDPDTEIVAVLPSVGKAVTWFYGNPEPDLVFMDIQLEDGISFEIFDEVEIKTPVIFTTAYDEYALKAFKVNSVDYLLKPLDPGELRKAMVRFNTLHRKNIDYGRLEPIIREFYPAKKERFLVKVGEHYRSVPLPDIKCFYIEERCTFILDNDGRRYPVDYSLDRIEQLADAKSFFRVNRNFIVNYYSIRDVCIYSSNRLKIVLHAPAGNTCMVDILVSRERVAGFKEWMDR